jgi:hypothetical protein
MYGHPQYLVGDLSRLVQSFDAELAHQLGSAGKNGGSP